MQTSGGWRIDPCFSHAQRGALGHPEWWPGMRIAEPIGTALGQHIASNTRRCPAGGGGALSSELMTGIAASAACDPDGAGPLPALAQPPEFPCGLPYVLVQRVFEREWRGRTIYSNRLFKAVAFEHINSVRTELF